jgi:hypothetical protein
LQKTGAIDATLLFEEGRDRAKAGKYEAEACPTGTHRDFR